MAFGGWFGKKIYQATKPVRKVVVGGIEKVADDVLGIDDSGGIVGSVEKIGDKIWDGLTEVGDEIKKLSENPYVRLAISVAYPQFAAYYNAAVKLNSGEELNAADIAAVAASAGTQDFAEGFKLTPEEAKTLKEVTAVATADNPGEAFVQYFGADIAEKVGLTDAVDSALTEAYGSEVAQTIKDNREYVADAARYATGSITEEQLVAKYGGNAISYATEGTSAEDYNKMLVDGFDVAVGNKTIEDVVVDTYGDQIAQGLGADTTNERAIALGGLTTLSQVAQGKDIDRASYAGFKKAYDQGARLEDLEYMPQVAGLDVNFDLSNILPNIGVDFNALNLQGYDLQALKDLNIDFNQLNVQIPDILSGDYSLPEFASAGLDLGNIDFSGLSTGELGDYNLKELGDMGIDVNQLNLQPEFQMIGLAQLLEPTAPVGVQLKKGEELASLESDFDLTPSDNTLFSREVLSRTFS